MAIEILIERSGIFTLPRLKRKNSDAVTTTDIKAAMGIDAIPDLNLLPNGAKNIQT